MGYFYPFLQADASLCCKTTDTRHDVYRSFHWYQIVLPGDRDTWLFEQPVQSLYIATPLLGLELASS